MTQTDKWQAASGCSVRILTELRSEKNRPSASDCPREVPNFYVFFSFSPHFIPSHEHQNRLRHLGARYQRTDTLPSSLNIYSFLPHLSSLLFRLSNTNDQGYPQHGSCTVSLTTQSLVSYTSLNKFLTIPFSHFFYTLNAALTRTFAYSGHRPRRLGPFSRDGLCFRSQRPPTQTCFLIRLASF